MTGTQGPTMRAAVVDRYGPPDVVRVTDVPAPTPRSAEVVVRVRAAGVTVADSRIRAARFPRGFTPFGRLAFGLTRPRRKILGGTFSGVVEAVGADVTGLVRGEEVCGTTGARLGAHAELVAVPAERVVRKPAGVSHEDAAGVVFGGLTALYFLRDKASVTPGRRVLVNGASGAVGTNAVQLAKHYGATVTAVTSTRNVELVTRLGADQVVDYTRTSLSEVDDRFDVVLDTVGTVSARSGRRLLTDDGRLLLAAADLWELLRARGPVTAGSAPERAPDVELLLALVADGALAVVTDQVVDLDDITEGHRRVDTGHKVGNVVVRL